MDKYTLAALSIIKEQEVVAGPIALDLARLVHTIHFSNGSIAQIDGDPKVALENLVMQYQKLFGNTSVEVSKQAIKHSKVNLSPEELPSILK